MPELTLIATTVAKPAHADAVAAAMARLVAPTRREPGCLEYVMHRGADDPTRIVFYERWESDAHLDAHTRTPHFLECMEAIDGLTDTVELVRLRAVASD
ncbi:MAG TPA: putative quinol monooxygenase [Candidatus Krumholzibacteria bacterium]|nr:putative quinol monooxygenase [Candidatus Krumholzibacteria bacterium]